MAEIADRAAGAVKSGVSRGIAAFFEYDTPKIVHIKSKTVGIINRVIQLGILAYIIGYAIVYEKGYQDFEEVESVALTKVKGVTYLTEEKFNRSIPGVTNRTWDVADYVVPPEESDACFVTTNVIVTLQQRQAVCAEDPSMPDVKCQRNGTDCTPGEPVANGNGVRTGDCIPYLDTGINTCAIHAWCPVEVDNPPDPPALIDSQTFTVLIKNWVEFPKFKTKRRNIIDDINNKTYLQNCRYNSDDPIDQFCPIFEMGVIAKEAGVDYDEISASGGVIAVNIHWDCNLDFSISKCVPKYTFSRLDDKNAQIAKGWNFRYANYYRMDGEPYRDLIKAYGIRLVIKVSGRAGKFSVVPLLLNFGAGIGLLAIATVLCDLIAIKILKKGDYYEAKKYLMVVDPDDMQGSGSHHEDSLPRPNSRSPNSRSPSHSADVPAVDFLPSSQNSYDDERDNLPTNRRGPKLGTYETLEEN